jgi:hypothetical protein
MRDGGRDDVPELRGDVDDAGDPSARRDAVELTVVETALGDVQVPIGAETSAPAGC